MEKFWGDRATRAKSNTLIKRTPPVGAVSEPLVSPNLQRSRASLAAVGLPSKPPVDAETSRGPHVPLPVTRTEQYWAARALSAETLLAARTTHHNEVRGILSAAESKRTKALDELAREHNERYARLEKLVIGLVSLLVIFAAYVTYLMAHSSRKEQRSRLSTLLPNHFTIPILSPFTSVVESETAAIGARVIALLIVVTGVVAYGILRHWMNFGQNRSS